MTDAVVTALREIANRDLYQRNAFHITGLSTGVDRRTTRRRQQHVTAVLEAGADLETSGSTDPDELRIAFDRLLGDPRRRLVDEVFGEWGRPTGECGCDVPVHQAHDEAVYAHASAIELLLAPPGQQQYLAMWRRAGERWTTAMEDPQFWQHLRNRVLSLDDWQLAASAIDQIRSELSAALTGPLLDLATTGDYPARVAKVLEDWPIGGAATQRWVLDAMRPQYERAEDATVALLRRLQQGHHEVDPVISELDRSVLPVYRRLQVMLPSEQHQRTLTLRDDIALVYHNGAVGIANEGSVHDERITQLLDQADGYAGTPAMKAKIMENRVTAQFLARNTPHYSLDDPPEPMSTGCIVALVVFIAVVFFILVAVFS
ncbi:hypothetical protein GCM10029976_029750 [Kribbella albertanoniae]|uniref:Uncharacterized protein n=1 Tax=Kribbella albertanoniae TaxID=1266829 RepID=A0A4R4Q8P9_9ACTN|nr:hypothetical protein [Kribbella albertanoniae]TDC31731.1 hypothetical protein E1261_10295 [Kribbella albertanoniae]